MSYMTGYNGTVRTLAELQAWPQWQNLDPENQRRALAVMDASNAAGTPLGIGEIFRSGATQTALFFSRHHEVTSGGCCTYQGKRYSLNSGVAHAAPPGSSYHEATTPQGKALAIDFTGNLTFLAAHAAAYGLFEFSHVNNEPWHAQPVEIPHSRSGYNPAVNAPLPVFPLPGAAPTPVKPVPVKPVPVKIYAPSATIALGRTNVVADVKALQLFCNFFGWKDAQGRTLVVDGSYQQRSAQAVMSMQTYFKITADGLYGPKTQATLQAFLDAVAALQAH